MALENDLRMISTETFYNSMWMVIKIRMVKEFVWCEQGVGDTIMWTLAYHLLASQAEHCILECQPKLVLLLKRLFPNVEVKVETEA